MNTQPNNPNLPNPPNAPDPLAVALAKLDPAPHGFEWNAFMFAAGRASKTRALNFWRAIAGICAVIACGFALAYFTRPAVIVRERVVHIERAPQKVAEPPPAVPPAAPGVRPEVKPAR